VFGSSEQTGMGDITQSIFFSPKKPSPSGLIWGAGPVILLPTATDDLLGRVGRTTTARLDVLSAYVEAHKLGDALAKDEHPVTDVGRLAFDDGRRIAVAYVRTPKGREAFGRRLAKESEAMLEKYEQAYLRLCQKGWADVAYARFQVENVAVFLHHTGEFDDYLKWAEVEAARRKREHEKDLAERRETKKAREEERLAREHELNLKRMEYAYKLKEAKLEAAAKQKEDKRGEYNEWGESRYRDVYVPYRYRRRPPPAHLPSRPKPKPPIARPRPLR